MPNNAWNRIYKQELKHGYNYQYYDILKPHEDLGRFERALRKKIGISARVLDLGCGAGRNLVPLAIKGYELHGFDLSDEGLRQIRKDLRKKGLSAELKQGDIYKRLPYPKDYFDALMAVQVIQHGREEDILKLVGEIERVVRKGGLIFMTLPGVYENSKGSWKMRYYYNHDSREIAPRVKVRTSGNEKGVPHFYYNKRIALRHFRQFRMLEFWRDDRGYYCFVAEKK